MSNFEKEKTKRRFRFLTVSMQEMATVNPNANPESDFAVFEKWMRERMIELNTVMDDFKTLERIYSGWMLITK